ncbi:FHA domain-containing protein [Fusibacter bizertensis]
MYELIAMGTKYILTFIIYMFILKIAKLIYIDIKKMSVWEEAKVKNPHLKLLSSIEKTSEKAVTEIFPLKNAQITIGRSLDCEIAISDPHISSQHVQLNKTNQSYTLQDLGSANGTYVNGQKISSPVYLKEGDEILLGITKLVFSEGEELHE